MTAPIDRRAALATLASGALALACPTARAADRAATLERKQIPKTGESIPVIGMGTWQTFNVGADPALRRDRTAVLQTFFDRGGGLVDSSPMYGTSQAVVGHALDRIRNTGALFAADKIWTDDGDETTAQLEATRAKWDIPRLDLMQIHNLVAWKPHLETLRRLKAEGRIRYIGVTTSHGRRHDELARILASEPLDFVQLTYNMTHRDVEQRLLPLARDRGIAVIANRPFDGGDLIRRLQQKAAPLPPWAAEHGIAHWPQYLLKWTVSHPALTVAIPATTQVAHMRENMSAATGPLPDPATRDRMSAWLRTL